MYKVRSFRKKYVVSSSDNDILSREQSFFILEETGNSKICWCQVLLWYPPATPHIMQMSICFLQKVHLFFSLTYLD